MQKRLTTQEKTQRFSFKLSRRIYGSFKLEGISLETDSGQPAANGEARQRNVEHRIRTLIARHAR